MFMETKTMTLSEKHSRIKPSVTLKLVGKAKKMMAEGEDVINFTAGEPNFITPKKIRDAAVEAMDQGHTGYTGASGLPAFKEAIIEKLEKDNGLTYDQSQIVVSNGAKHSLYNALQAICNEGDEVLIPRPYWVSYPELVRMAGGVPVEVPLNADNGFEYDLSSIGKYLTEKTKAIIINSPNNPTGAVYGRKQLEFLGNFAMENGLYIISDEIYEHLLYDGEHISIATLSKSIKDRTIVINGLSKSYAMTGWRIGYAAANEKIAKLMGTIQSHATSNANTIAQYAGIAALEQCDDEIVGFKKVFEERRNLMVGLLNEIPGIDCQRPKGAFYVMVPVENYLGKSYKGTLVEDSSLFCNLLLDHMLVAAVPGFAFGLEGYIRVSYAASEEAIAEGVKRLGDFLADFN